MGILYIGGTGEISYACVRAGAAAGQDITVFNRARSVEPLPAGVRQIVGDLADPAAYGRLGHEGFDVVCQFIAYDLQQIERDREVFGGRVRQYVFISTASAYRKPPATWRITEDEPLANPYWPYSAAKAFMEARLMELHRQGLLPVTIIRPSHTYRRRIVGTIVKGHDAAWRMLRRLPVLCHGDGTSLWTATHSDDFAVPFVRLLGNPRAIGEAFHITSDESCTWNHIYGSLAAALNVEPRIVHVPTATLVRYNPDWTGPLWGDKAWPVSFDNTKVKSVAGDFHCRPIADGLRETAAIYLRDPAAWPHDDRTHELLDRIAAEQEALGR